jgi:hypothetical protein
MDILGAILLPFLRYSTGYYVEGVFIFVFLVGFFFPNDSWSVVWMGMFCS